MSCPGVDAKHCRGDPACMDRVFFCPTSVIRVDGFQAQAAVPGLDHTCPVEKVGGGASLTAECGPQFLREIGN